MKKTSNQPSSNTSASNDMSSSNTTPQDSQPTKMAASEPSAMATKESPTSSGVPQGAGSSPLRLNERAEDQQTTKSPSLNPSENAEASASLPPRSTPLFRRLIILIKFLYFRWVVTNLKRWHYRRRRIVKNPTNKPTKLWTDFSPEGKEKLRHLIAIMISTLNQQDWGMKLGIAAPQIGKNWRVMVAGGKVYVNPQFTPTKAPPEIITEGCYTYGKRRFKVPRAKYGWLKWQDTEGVEHEKKVTALEAIIVQHECDHLDGRSCVEKGEEIIDPGMS